MFNSKAKYTRRLSAMERYALVIHDVYHYHVDGVVEGVGDIDPERLRAAVAIAAEANPGVRVRLKGVLGFTRWVDSGIPPEVHVIEGCEWDGTSERNNGFMTERRLEAVGGGPIADVLLVRGKEKTWLIGRALHGAMDGRGMLHWITEIFRVLRGEAPLGSHSSLIDLDVQAQYKEKANAAPPPPPPGECLPVVPPTVTDEPLAYVWRRIVIDGNVSNQLPKTAVFLAAWARRQGKGDVGFTVPVDYRGLRTDEMSVGNLTGYLRLTVAEEDTPRSLMVQMRKRVDAYADVRQFRGIRALLWLPINFMAKKLREKLHQVLYTPNRDLPSGGIVSMGSWKPETFSCPGFDATMAYGIPGSVGKLNVLFSVFPDFNVVTFAAPAAYNRDGQLDEMIQAYQAHFSK